MTIKTLLLESFNKRGDAVALRFKKEGVWREVTYQRLLSNVRQVSQVLGGFRVKPKDRVAIYLDNCPEWPEIYLGIVSMGATAVPVDAKLREQEAAHVLRDSGARVVFASEKTYGVLREVEDVLPDLSVAVLIGGESIEPEESRRLRYVDYVTALGEVTESAAASDGVFNSRDPDEETIASIIYTSGTTGRQKGAMLTHHNFCVNVRQCLSSIEVSRDDNFLLVLPLHHSFAFTTNLLIPIAAGCEISFIESLKTVGENVREVSPTILIGVPLLIEKMYARIWAGLKSNKIAYLMYRAGLRGLVGRGIRKKLGGRLRMFVVGGAPADADILKAFAGLGIPIIEGYGLTETGPVLTLNPPDAPKPGTVGKAVPEVEIRIVDQNAEGVGEIVAKGPNVMRGYFNNAQATEDAIQDGWFMTGDLGFIDDDGYVVITGRKKNLIVNREGKNIYPEEVEAHICQSEFIIEAMVLGYSDPGEMGERVGIIVVPDQEAVDEHFQRRQGGPSDEELTELMKKEVQRHARNIAEYKRPRRIQVRTEEFEKTSTSKIKRYLYALDAEDV